MNPNTAVSLYLTILMVVLSAIALIGGHMTDKKNAEAKNKKA